jgi:hypothetical protein
MQYTLWDKLKMLNNFNNRQLINIARLMSYLFIHKALPLSILKVNISSTMHFLSYLLYHLCL